MFPYPEGDCPSPERVLLALYQAGAMTQSDLTSLFGWNKVRTTLAISSLNNGDVKVGGFREKIGVRNSGKIRVLTRVGIDLAGSFTGRATTRSMLKEGEARIAANLARFATKIAIARGGVNYYGPYLVPEYFPFIHEMISAPATPVSYIEIKSGIVWLDWIGEQILTIQDRVDAWYKIYLKLPFQTTNSNHKVMFICQTESIAGQVSGCIEITKEGFEMRSVFAENPRFNDSFWE